VPSRLMETVLLLLLNSIAVCIHLFMWCSGPWNSWDRQPYIHGFRGASGSVIPLTRKIHHNFFIGNYNALFAVDTDDGSSYVRTHAVARKHSSLDCLTLAEHRYCRAAGITKSTTISWSRRARA